MIDLFSSKQLILEIDKPATSQLDTFYFDADSSLATSLHAWLETPCKESFFYVWGSEGTGKTHLLKACCHFARQQGWHVAYLPTQLFSPLPAEIWDGLEHYDFIAIDDCNRCVADKFHAEKLLSLYENCLLQHSRLLLSANVSPHHLTCALPDLKSRLSMAMIFQLPVLNDEKKIKVLKLYAQSRDLKLPDPVAQYLLNHCPRQMQQLLHFLELLSKISLQKQKKLTIPFVKSVLPGIIDEFERNKTGG